MFRVTWLLLTTLVIGACSVDTLPAVGRPCSDHDPCGPNTHCSLPPGPRTCVQGTSAPDLALEPDADAGPVDAPLTKEDLGPSPDLGPPPDLPPPDLVPAPDCPTCPAGLSCTNGVCTCIQGGACAGCCEQNSCIPLGAQSLLVCGNGGEPCKSCDDSASCSVDSCENGSCKNTLDPGHCLIQQTCHKEGDLVSPCFKCLTAESVNWATVVGDPGCVTTLAGEGVPSFKDGPALSAWLHNPRNLAVDSAGVIYVADRDNHRIRMITGSPGSYKVSTLAGAGVASFKDGPAATAWFNKPCDVAVDSSGTIYVADSSNHRIRMITGSSGSCTVSTLAGNGNNGMQDGPAGTARFYFPRGVAVDGAGKIYVADADNHRVRLIAGSPGSYTVSTLAGDGSNGMKDGPAATARFSFPVDVAVDSSGKLIVVADLGNSRVRAITLNGGAYTVSTAAGTGVSGFLDGPTATAQLDTPLGVTIDGTGKIYVADGNNFRVRLIAAGIVSTVAGTGTAGYSNGPVAMARVGRVAGVALLPGGLLVADMTNNRIRMLHY